MSENRGVPRQRVLKKGRIIFNNGRSTIDCTVRNLSANGARLALASVIGLPDSFELSVGEESPRHCRIAWRTATEIGVEFVGGS